MACGQKDARLGVRRHGFVICSFDNFPNLCGFWLYKLMRRLFCFLLTVVNYWWDQMRACV